MPAGDNTVLSVSGLHISFAGKEAFTAVNDISFAIDRGKTLAIVGESGSGKSLTALALMGLLPKSAEAMVAGFSFVHSGPKVESGESVGNNPTKTISQINRGLDAGMVFQEPMSSLNPVMSIGKQLREAILVHQKVSSKEGKRLAIEWLNKVQLPEPVKMYDRYAHQLSGGQKQRVMIAMAMCNYPALLIADEPTTALDVTVQHEIIRLMHYLQQEHGSAMIFITHDLALAATIADDVLVMYRGQTMEYGPAAQVLAQPQHPYTKALLACRPSPEQKGYHLPTVTDFMDADKARDTVLLTERPQPEVQKGDVLLDVKNLRVWFAEEKNLLGKPLGYYKAVDDVSFTLHKGEVLGLVGESGCGKSTVSKAITGLLPVHSGSLIYKGEDLAHLPVRGWTRVRRQVQMIFQDPYSSLNPRMTVGDMLAEPLVVHNMVSRRELQNEVRRLLGLVQLPADAAMRYPHQFSGGQRQRLGIARALALRPELLICDESVSALDVSIQAQILNLLRELQHEFQLTYLFISHDLSVVHYISDRVLVMQAGKIVESGDAEQVLKHPAEAYTQRLVAAMP